MEFEFDKEIDSLLRGAARGETVQTFAAHPDADEISLFAENALPARARARTVEHLAECARCRKILSNLIAFNAETESETVRAGGESKIVTIAPGIPWYRRLFAFPQITFAMGALVLVLGGIMALMVLQTAYNSQSPTVAQRDSAGERPLGATGASSDENVPTAETYSANASANMANRAAAAKTNTAMSAAANTMTAANTSANVAATPAQIQQPPQTAAKEAPRPDDNAAAAEVSAANANAAMNKPNVAATPAPARDAEEKAKTTDLAKNEKDEKKRAEEQREMMDASRAQTAPAPLTAMAKKAMRAAPGETRSVGGKTFRNVGGIWFDAAYTSQPQKTVRRGSDDYKKLDSGLRSIAENLSGTVVVLWKDKAYRIQ